MACQHSFLIPGKVKVPNTLERQGRGNAIAILSVNHVLGFSSFEPRCNASKVVHLAGDARRDSKLSLVFNFMDRELIVLELPENAPSIPSTMPCQSFSIVKVSPGKLAVERPEGGERH